MRPQQNRRMRGRSNNRNKGPNPLTRSYESNGPDVKIRGTAQHIADKYAQLARDAQSSGDPVAAENYLQHAEHYYRIIAAAQEQFREQYGAPPFQRPFDEEGDEDGSSFGGPGERQQAGDDDIGSQPQPFEARPDQGERQDRFERGDRQDRGERFQGRDQGRDRFNRGGPDRGDRFQGRDQGRDRFPRDDRPRQDFQRPDYQRPDDGRQDRPDRPEYRQDQPRQDQPRQDRQERPDRQDRTDRQDQPRFDRRPRRDEAEEAGVNGLPAFLTTPVRAPIGVEEADAEGGAPPSAVNGEAPFKPRRRRRPRFEGSDGTGEAGADFAPETPPAE